MASAATAHTARSVPRITPTPCKATGAVFLGLVLLLLSSAGCDDDSEYPTRALFDLTDSMNSDLFAIPYPSDLRVAKDGTMDLAGLEKGQPDLIKLYFDTVEQNRLGGFSTAGAAFFRFSDKIDTRCLPPTPEASMESGASVFWVNLQSGSVNFGKRVPVRWKFTAAKQNLIKDNSLAVLPVPGFPLDPGALHAVILTEILCDSMGDPVQPSRDFEVLLDDRAPGDSVAAEVKRAHGNYAPLRKYLATTGITGVISAALFTTGKPSDLAGKARAVLHRGAAPVGSNLTLWKETTKYREILGTYNAQNFQSGTPPFMNPADGGEILLDAKGDPKTAYTETMRFSVTVPRGVMPAAGWPIVIYAHGTGGSYRSHVSKVAPALAEVKDDSGQVISKLAVVGIDQVLHGPRASGSPSLTFFNLFNPVAAAHNVVQGGIDDFSLLRMIKGLSADRVQWHSKSGKSGMVRFTTPFKFDPKRIFFMGHSQGGLTGPVFLAHEPEIRGAVLSGAGGGLILTLLGKTSPVDIPSLVKTALGGEVPTEFHPMMTFLQQMLDIADTNNYGPMLIRRPPKGVAPKHIFLSQGFVDHYTPNASTDALAVAIGLPQADTTIRAIDDMDLRGLDWLPTPLAGNLSVGGAAITGALLQYRATKTTRTCTRSTDCYSGDYCESGYCHDDGHYVIFNDPRAIRQFTRFLATLARDGVPVIFP